MIKNRNSYRFFMTHGPINPMVPILDVDLSIYANAFGMRDPCVLTMGHWVKALIDMVLNARNLMMVFRLYCN